MVSPPFLRIEEDKKTSDLNHLSQVHIAMVLWTVLYFVNGDITAPILPRKRSAPSGFIVGLVTSKKEVRGRREKKFSLREVFSPPLFQTLIGSCITVCGLLTYCKEGAYKRREFLYVAISIVFGVIC